MKRKSIITVLLFLLSFGLMEVHKLAPSSTEKVSLFINSDEKLQLQWYVKDTASMLTMIITLIAFCLAIEKSFIKSVIHVLMGFYMFDLLMYWYDFKQSEWLYTAAYTMVTTFLILLSKKWSSPK